MIQMDNKKIEIKVPGNKKIEIKVPDNKKIVSSNELEQTYHTVSFLDVNEILTFAKKEYSDINKEIKEEERVEIELKKFIDNIEKNTGHKMHHIGHETSYGVDLMRFLLHNNGFLEIIVGKPLTINAHFIDKKNAEEFAKALKKTLDEHIPDSPVKNMVLNSVRLKEGSTDTVSLNEWTKMHKIVFHRAAFYSLITLFVFTTIEATQEFFEAVAGNVLHVQSIIISIVTALIIGFFFDPVKNLVDKFLEGILTK